jgi:arsenical pump membrane protein
VGLIAGSVIAANNLPAAVVGAALIGVDLGPNLSAPVRLRLFSGW